MGDEATISAVVRGTLLLLAVINPIGNIPLFVDLTDSMDDRRRGRVLNSAVFTGLAMALFFALVGDVCLRFLFQVTLGEFKIAGGILLFVVAARGVLSPTARFIIGQVDDRFIAFFPLAFPIIVGPGTLAVTIILAQRNGHLLMALTVLLTFTIVFAIVRGSPFLSRVLGPHAGLIIARLLYIFLAAKAVALTIDGLREELPL